MASDMTPDLLRGMIPLVALAGSAVVASVWIFTWAARRSIKDRAFEQSRREIAAYIAEGSVSAEDGATLLAVQSERARTKDPAKRLAQHVAWGMVNKKDAKALADAREGVSEATWRDMVELCVSGLPVEQAVKVARSRASAAPAKTV